MKKTKFGKTWRKTFNGATVKDGEYCKKCPEENCDVCVHGTAKHPYNKKFRREGKKSTMKEFAELIEMN